METITSKVAPGSIIAIVHRRTDMAGQQAPGVDLTPEREFLQVRSLRAPAGKTYDAHKHLEQVRTTNQTQEAIIVIQGRVEVRFYDLDDAPLDRRELGEGDCVIALAGGHAFTVLAADTLMYELKNGPYNGLAKDKVRIV